MRVVYPNANEESSSGAKSEADIAVSENVELSEPQLPSSIENYHPVWQRFLLENRVELTSEVMSPHGIERGEVTFLLDGSVNLGNKVYAGGSEIVNHQWGACVANRAAGALQLLAIDRPEGETYYYCYQRGVWYRYVPQVGERNIFIQTFSERLRQSGWWVASKHWFYEVMDGAVSLAWVVGLSIVAFGARMILKQ